MSTYQYHANCPHCATQIKFNDEHTGHETPCPTCGKGVVLAKPSNDRVVLNNALVTYCVVVLALVFLFWEFGGKFTRIIFGGSSSVDCPKCKVTISVKNDKCIKCDQFKMGINISSGNFYATCRNCNGSQTKKCQNCGFGRD